jgi:hypothetical protein
MPEQLIDSIGGDGRVFNGAVFVADVACTVHIYQKFVDAGGSLVRTQKRCHLTILSSSQRLPVDRTVYALHMANGDKLDFFMDSATTAQATGGIYH